MNLLFALAPVLGALRRQVEAGTFQASITAADLEALRAAGKRVGFFDWVHGTEPAPIHFDRDNDLLVMRFAVDLTGVKRLDWELGLHGIGVVKLHPDIEFDAADGAVFTCCEVELARAGALAARRAGVNLFARFWAVDDDGARRLLVEMSGDYDVE